MMVLGVQLPSISDIHLEGWEVASAPPRFLAYLIHLAMEHTPLHIFPSNRRTIVLEDGQTYPLLHTAHCIYGERQTPP